jgi:DNA-directed RNA polymerase specialized sigma24 family protein
VPIPIGPDEIQRYVDAANKVDPISADQREEILLSLEKLRQIDDGCFQALFKRYFLDWSVARIANELGIKENTAGKRILRCLDACGKLITERLRYD